MSLSVTDGVSAVLATALNGLTARQNVVANDLANVDTPGFQASTIQFEDALKQAINGHQFNDVSNGAASPQVPVTALATQTPEGANGNNVDFRQEEMTMIQTQYSYQVLGRALSDHYDLIKTATVMA